MLRKSGPHSFKALSAIELHKKEFRFHEGAVRIADSAGHMTMAFVARPSDLARLRDYGQGKLLARGNDLFFILPVNVTAPEPSAEDAIGVDLGIANIATDSNGRRYSGAKLRGIRYRRRRLRTRLQLKGTRSAKRRLKMMRRKESRFNRDINHVISKQLVATAERTKSALVLEDLNGIRRRVRATRKAQRAELSSWSFYQLREFVTYKAALAGVPVIFVDPRNTSRECSACGHIAKQNRTSQATFKCRQCGFTAHADFNAALVIRSRGLFSGPYATSAHHLVASPLLDG